MLKVHPSIQTFSNRQFDFLDPRSDQFTIGDIAHALSHICRFAGHTRKFYSVAQHCYLASQYVSPKYAMHALLHDAAEAFIGDISTPLKQLLPDYKVIEKRVEAAIFKKFGIEELPQEVHEVDRRLLITEQRDLMPTSNPVWTFEERPYNTVIIPLKPKKAYSLFLDRYNEIIIHNNAVY